MHILYLFFKSLIFSTLLLLFSIVVALQLLDSYQFWTLDIHAAGPFTRLFLKLRDTSELSSNNTTTVTSDVDEQKALRFTILHTSDLHSQFHGVGPDTMYHGADGHYARMKFAIRTLQDRLNPFATLTVDAGDWNSGTLFHLIQVSYLYPNLVPEFQFLNDSLYDATILGNHEFDGNEEALSYMIEKANRNGIRLPILSSNMYFDKPEENGEEDESGEEKKVSKSLLHDGCSRLRRHYTETCDNMRYLPTRAAQNLMGVSMNDCLNRNSDSDGVFITPYVLRELKSSAQSKRSVKVAILGVFSINAAQTSVVNRKCTRFHGSYPSVNFGELIQAIRRRIVELKSKHHPDVIVILNHSGEDEDERIVRSLLRWDKNSVHVHISSHTHSVYVKRVGRAVLAQAGPYAVNLGSLQFSFDFNSRQLTLLNEFEPVPTYFPLDSSISQRDILPPRIPINSATPYDADTFNKIQSYKKIIDETFLRGTGYSFNTRLGTITSKKPSSVKEASIMVCDALLEEINLELKNHSDHCGHNNTHTPVDFVMVSPSGIRVEYFAVNGTSLQFSDVFRMMGIGTLNSNITSDNLSGIRLAHFYLSKKQVRQTIMNIEIASRFINEMMSVTFSSTLSYKLRAFGIPYYNLLDITLHQVALDAVDRDLIHVAMPAFIAAHLKLTRKMSKGLLSFDMKDRYGRDIDQPFISDYPDYIYLARHLQKHYPQ